MKINVFLPIILLAFIVIFSACYPAQDNPLDQAISSDEPPQQIPEPLTQPDFPIEEKSIVEHVELIMLESFPLQVHAIIRGALPNGCTFIVDTSQEKQDNNIVLHIFTQTDSRTLCTEAEVPFEQIIPLDVNGLPAGNYQVVLNDKITSFTFHQDNFLQDESSNNMTCPPEDEQQILFNPVEESLKMGFCFLYPVIFTHRPEFSMAPVVLTGPEHSIDQESFMALLAITVTDAFENDLESYIQDLSKKGFLGKHGEIEYTHLGSNDAILIEGYPEPDGQRHIFVRYNDQDFHLVFKPISSKSDQANQDMEDLFLLVTHSWTFTE
ncbi:MAG: hypothetical protein JEZ06_12425 [Anaerolineaceae bacterium]|nr:hypothetical protein [Anaerolineaceae bacterium]